MGTIVACEVVLQLLSWASLRVTHEMSPAHYLTYIEPNLPSVMITDPILRHRGNPLHPAHDRLGFHNVFVPKKIDVVALGDSQTYGPIGHPEDAWPAALASLSGKTVYNMSIGGWDAVDYLSILGEAFERRPDTILLGVYLGNDVYGAFRTVHTNGIRTDLATPGDTSGFEALEKTDPLAGAIDRMVLAAPPDPTSLDRRLRATSFRSYVSRNSRFLWGASLGKGHGLRFSVPGRGIRIASGSALARAVVLGRSSRRAVGRLRECEVAYRAQAGYSQYDVGP